MRPFLILAALLALPASVPAHGSVYTPPPNLPTQKSGIPDPAKPPGYGGSPVVGPGTPGAGSPMTPEALLQAGVDMTRWTWWWEFNRAPYLDLRRMVLSSDPTSGGGEFLGQGSAAMPGLAPTPARIRDELLPALFRVLETESQPDLVSSTLIALARVGDDLPDDDRQIVADHLRPFLRDGSQELSEAAVIALGILGHVPSATLLASVAADDPLARSLLGRSSIPARMRSLAAYGLGMLARASEREDVRRYAVHELAKILDDERRSAGGELEGACILALGIVPLKLEATPASELETSPPASGRMSQIAYLERVLLDRSRSDFARAQVPLSIARLAGGDLEAAWVREHAAKLLLARLAPMRREPNGVVQASVVGLGQLLDADDSVLSTSGRRALRQIDADHSDRGVRRFARIALAQIAGRTDDPDSKGLAEVRRFLLTELSRGNTEERAWAAVSLGVLERARLDRGALPSEAVASALRDALASAKAPDQIGACAIGLGLMRDPGAHDVLLKQLRSVRDDEARGYVALALGMTGARQAKEELQRLIDGSLYRPLILKEAAVGLALLGDKSSLERMLQQLAESRSVASQAALARAVGLVGDARGFEGLVGVVLDAELSATARAFAVVALGLSGDLDLLPWSVPLSVNGNHMKAPVTLYDDQGLGLLNLL